jgi:hypothetical protein
VFVIAVTDINNIRIDFGIRIKKKMKLKTAAAMAAWLRYATPR